MAGYHISVQHCVDDTREYRVSLVDEGERAVGTLDALSADHARMIAADLMALVRHRDPTGAFVLDTFIESRAA